MDRDRTKQLTEHAKVVNRKKQELEKEEFGLKFEKESTHTERYAHAHAHIHMVF